MSRQHYEENLRHVVRPEEPSSRESSTVLPVLDWEGLLIRRALRNFAAYEAETDEQRDIALAYGEYIDMVVRDERKAVVPLFAHTEAAIDVLRTVGESIDQNDPLSFELRTLGEDE